jgi:hypothetical protein
MDQQLLDTGNKGMRQPKGAFGCDFFFQFFPSQIYEGKS